VCLEENSEEEELERKYENYWELGRFITKKLLRAGYVRSLLKVQL
jgi:hypothetical protein